MKENDFVGAQPYLAIWGGFWSKGQRNVRGGSCPENSSVPTIQQRKIGFSGGHFHKYSRAVGVADNRQDSFIQTDRQNGFIL